MMRRASTLKAFWGLLTQTYTEWTNDNVPRLGAALAYYTVFSLAPLLIIVIAIAGLAFGREAAQGQIVGQIQGLVGIDGAQAIETMIEHARSKSTGIIAAIIGLFTLLFGASGAFGQLQDALNTIWDVTPKPGRGIWGLIKDRFFSFLMVVGVGFLLLVSLVLSAAIAAVGEYLNQWMASSAVFWQIVNTAVSLAIITLLFAMTYKVLPDVKLGWSDVWVGAAFTAVLFTIGKLLIGLYLGKSGVGSTYGAAGSLVIILIWVYYSAQILLFGAEFTYVYAAQYGSGVRVADNAVTVGRKASGPGTEGAPDTPEAAETAARERERRAA